MNGKAVSGGTVAALLLLGGAAACGADLDNGREINQVCATCHGEFGEGGKQGMYPRLAGLPAAYTARQLRLFRSRARPNLPMVEHTDEMELPDADVEDIAAYLATLKLATRMPPIDPDRFDPYERLLLAKRVFNVPRAPGDVERGERLYGRECRSCHGDAGRGRSDKGVPFLAGQYTEYLWRQVRLLVDKQRIHDPEAPQDELLSLFDQQELRDIFAYLSTADDD